MKKLFALCLSFLSLLNPASGQGFEKAIKPYFYTWFNCITDDGNGGWIAAGYGDNTNSFFKSAYVTRLDSVGNTMWSYNAATWEYAAVNDIIHTSDNNFIVIGPVRGCDWGPGGGYVQKISPNGLMIWNKEYQWVNDYFEIPFSEILELHTAEFLLSVDSILLKADANGDSLWSSVYQYGTINSILENHRHQYLLGCDNGIVKTDSSGTVQSFVPFSQGVSQVYQLPDSSYLLLSGTELIRTDTLFSTITSVNLSPLFWNVSSFDVGTNICAAGTTQSGAGAITFDLQLQPLDTSFFGEAEPRDVAATTTGYALAGIEHTSQNNNAFIKTFDNSLATVQHATDAGIVSVRIDTVYTQPVPSAPPGVYDIFFDTRVTIKNFGNDTINGLYINSRFIFFSACAINRHLSYYSAPLAPGDSTELHLGLLQDYSLYYPTGGNYSACFWTSVPNSKIDSDHSNDSACFSLAVPTGMQELDRYDLSIYPNPAHDILTIELPSSAEPVTQAIIYNSLGQIVMSREIKAGSGQVDISPLSPGVYFIEVFLNDRIARARLVKQ